jgi:MFS superfamily sulfate permease-like transporter
MIQIIRTARQPMAPPNRYDLHELAGAFGDLGTLIPFVVAYVSLLKMDPGGILLPFGIALIAVGLLNRTPFPVQPMKAVGAAAITQTVGLVTLTPAMVAGATLATGLFWLALAATGLAKRLAQWIPKPALLGVIMGLGFSFMLEGIRMMAQHWALAAALLALTFVVMARTRVPATVLLLLAGATAALVDQPTLAHELAAIRPALRFPDLAWQSLGWKDVWLGALLLALPQLPLTFGNALIAITEENNRLFPDRPVNERRVAFSTAAMNLGSSLLGGIPMCHGAGGLAGHVKFGARTGGASVMLGALLTVTALFFAESVGTAQAARAMRAAGHARRRAKDPPLHRDRRKGWRSGPASIPQKLGGGTGPFSRDAVSDASAPTGGGHPRGSRPERAAPHRQTDYGAVRRRVRIDAG